MIVFLIDDDRDDHELFGLAISELKASMELFTACDGIEGLKMLSNPEFNPDFIFIDMNMPKMTGLECIEKIKEINRLNNVPVFIYSTSVNPSVTENCKKLGAAGVIEKQTSIRDTYKVLHNVFEGRIAGIM